MTLFAHEWSPRRDAADRAPTAVLVHGIAGWHRTWWRVAPALADRGWRAVAVDQLGHGRSPRIDGTAKVGDFAAAMAEVVDRRRGPIDLLLGHSLGAAAAAELAHRRPGITKRLVLEDPPAVTRVDDVGFQRRFEAEVLASRRDPAAEVRRVLVENPRWLEEDVRQEVEGRAMTDLDGMLASLRAGIGVRVVELAPQLALPTLWLLADDERSVLGTAREQVLCSLPPSAESVCFEAGHVVHRDRFDDYLATILAWLDETPDD